MTATPYQAVPTRPRWFRVPKQGSLWHFGDTHVWGRERFMSVCSKRVEPDQTTWRRPVRYTRFNPPNGEPVCPLCARKRTPMTLKRLAGWR